MPSSVETPLLRWYTVISLSASRTRVRIQTQILVAAMCISPKRASTLKRWMLSWSRKEVMNECHRHLNASIGLSLPWHS